MTIEERRAAHSAVLTRYAERCGYSLSDVLAIQQTIPDEAYTNWTCWFEHVLSRPAFRAGFQEPEAFVLRHGMDAVGDRIAP